MEAWSCSRFGVDWARLGLGCLIDDNDHDHDDVLLNDVDVDVDVDVFRLRSYSCMFYPPACASLNSIYNGVEVFFFNLVSAGDSISNSAISCRTVGESSPVVLVLHSRNYFPSFSHRGQILWFSVTSPFPVRGR